MCYVTHVSICQTTVSNMIRKEKNNVLGYTCFDLSNYCVKYD